MARSLENKTNVDAPDSDYPYGRIRNNNGTGNGTPVNEQVYGDFHQFFAKLLAEAGITPNELPDNAYSGFQYFEALIELIKDQDDWINLTLINSATNFGINPCRYRVTRGNRLEISARFTSSGSASGSYAFANIPSGLIPQNYGMSVAIVNVTDEVPALLSIVGDLSPGNPGALFIIDAAASKVYDIHISLPLDSIT